MRDVTNMKRSVEWLNMESKNLSYSLKVNEFADSDKGVHAHLPVRQILFSETDVVCLPRPCGV